MLAYVHSGDSANSDSEYHGYWIGRLKNKTAPDAATNSQPSCPASFIFGPIFIPIGTSTDLYSHFCTATTGFSAAGLKAKIASKHSPAKSPAKKFLFIIVLFFGKWTKGFQCKIQKMTRISPRGREILVIVLSGSEFTECTEFPEREHDPIPEILQIL